MVHISRAGFVASTGARMEVPVLILGKQHERVGQTSICIPWHVEQRRKMFGECWFWWANAHVWSIDSCNFDDLFIRAVAMRMTTRAAFDCWWIAIDMSFKYGNWGIQYPASILSFKRCNSVMYTLCGFADYSCGLLHCFNKYWTRRRFKENCQFVVNLGSWVYRRNPR